jgi:general secretion pathway protein N
MMRAWAMLGAVSGVLLALLVHAPAAWVAGLLMDATDARIQIREPQGTVWGGNGRLSIGSGALDADAVVLPGRVSWSWGWDAGALTLVVRADCCTPQPQRLHLVPGWNRLTLALGDGQSQWPAALLAGLGAPWNTVQAEGELQLRSQGMSVEWFGEGPRWRGQLQLDALAMASRLSTLRPVGSYRLVLVAPPADQPPTVQLTTLEGPLRLEGSGQWSGAGWRFRGEARADPPSESALANLLNMVGRREGDKSVLSLG